MRIFKYLFFLTLFVLFMTLGKMLDVTAPAQKADIIVYLGGGLSERPYKTLELYRQGYSKTGTIIFTGSKRYFHTRHFGKRNSSTDKKSFFIHHGIAPEHLVYYNASNTMQEVRFVKRYLLEHRLHNALIVTDPPHSRRVQILTKMTGYEKNGLHIVIVGSGVRWWNPSFYFLSKEGFVYAHLEVLKILHNLFVYGVLEQYGMLENAKVYFGSLYHQIKAWFLSTLSRVWE